MLLYFKQRFFSWLDSYDVYDQDHRAVYTVEGKFSWGHRLEVSDYAGQHLATLQEQVLAFLPRFNIEVGGRHVGTIHKEFTFLRPSFSIDCNGWRVEGDFWEWNYHIVNASGQVVARIEKQLLNFTDTYTINVLDSQDALLALLVVLAIDAVKCSEN